MERIRDLWDDWWKVLAILAVIVGAVWLVYDCNQSERDEFLTCFRESLPSGDDVLYEIFRDEQIPHYDRIDRYEAIRVAEMCYDDTRGTNSPGDGEPLDRR